MLLGYGVNTLKKSSFEIQAVRFPKNDAIFAIENNRLKFLYELNVEPMKKVDKNQFKNYYSYRITDPAKYSQFVAKKLPNNVLLIMGKQ